MPGFEWVDIIKIGGPTLFMLIYFVRSTDDMKKEQKDAREKAEKKSESEKEEFKNEIKQLRSEMRDMRSEHSKEKAEYYKSFVPLMERVADSLDEFIRQARITKGP